MRLALIGLAVLTGAFILKRDSRPLGIRNNNPLNLREEGIPWNGKTGSNGGFTTFAKPFDGIRAAANDMKNGWILKGENTITKIVSAWAPTVENNTAAYIASVAKKTGLDPNATITRLDDMTAIIEAMIYHENGQQPYSKALIAEAVEAGATYGRPLPGYFDLTRGNYGYA